MTTSPDKTPSEPSPDNNAAWDAEDAQSKQRHPPVAPKDEGILDSIGKSISEGLTGADTSTNKTPPR